MRKGWIVLGLSGVVGIAQAASVFTENFETWSNLSPNSYLTYNAGVGGNGWTVTGTSVDLVRDQWSSTPDGKLYWLDLAGTPGPGGITRELSGLTIGQTYTVSFDAFSNDGKSVDAQLGAANQNFSSLLGSAWTHESFTWTAGSSTATLAFSTTDTSNGNTGIDNVSVEAVPEPFTMALALSGAAAAFGRIRRKRA